MYNLLMKKYKFALLFIFLTAFVLRLSVIVLAHHGDLNNNISWGTVAYEHGLNGLYEGKGLPLRENGEVQWPYSAPNQPPLTILFFAFLRLVWQHLRDFFWYMNWELQLFPSRLVWFWDEKGMDVLVKLPSIIADLGIGVLIYRYFEKKKKLKIALLLTTLWLFNPLVWYNSTIWGQTDSVVNLLGLIAILALTNKDLVKFAVFFSLSFLFKGSLGIFIPVLLFVAVAQRHPVKVWIKTIAYSLITAVLVSLWFHPNPDFFLWLFNLYTQRILPGEIGYLSANSFNFWWLVDSGKVLDNTYYFGLTARVWGIIITISGMGLIIKWLSKDTTDKRIFISLSLSSFLAFLFMTRIHERYLYPFFPLASIILGFIPTFWPIYLVLSITHLLNLYNLFWAPSIPFFEELLKNESIPKIISFINISMLPFIVGIVSFHRSKKI